MSHSSVIKIKNASVTYFEGQSNEVRALKGINLEIQYGEFVIFFGPSGCGKSTLLYAIAGLERQVKGSIEVEGREVTALSDRELEKHYQKTIGIIFQAFYLIPSLSVEKNVILPQMALGGKVKERSAKAKKLLKYFGVLEQSEKLPSELSGGQQQRVAICRALMNDPHIILADEPVGNLDSKSATDVLGLIQDLNISQKKTIILVTHDPSHLGIADRVFYMKDGEIERVSVNQRKIRPGELAKAKINNLPAVREHADSVDSGGTLKQKESLIRLAETYPEVKKFWRDKKMSEYKARQIVCEVLTGLDSTEIRHIESMIKSMLFKGVFNERELFDYLDADESLGGLGMDRRHAALLVKRIKSIILEAYMLGVKPRIRGKFSNQKINRLGACLLSDCGRKLNDNYIAVNRVNQIIKFRLENKINRLGVQNMLDTPINSGGAGLDKRNARKLARHLELILLLNHPPGWRLAVYRFFYRFMNPIVRTPAYKAALKDIKFVESEISRAWSCAKAELEEIEELAVSKGKEFGKILEDEEKRLLGYLRCQIDTIKALKDNKAFKVLVDEKNELNCMIKEFIKKSERELFIIEKKLKSKSEMILSEISDNESKIATSLCSFMKQLRNIFRNLRKK